MSTLVGSVNTSLQNVGLRSLQRFYEYVAVNISTSYQQGNNTVNSMNTTLQNVYTDIISMNTVLPRISGYTLIYGVRSHEKIMKIVLPSQKKLESVW